jgi:KaiC/GvpD/RAD55 family RecA-like ATPase
MTEYTYEIQKLFLEMMIADAATFVRIQNIYNVENFHPNLQPAAEFIEKHSTKYGTLPELSQLLATTNVKLEPLPEEINEGHYDWFFEEFEAFTKRQELERAVLAAADLLDKGEFEPVLPLVKAAVEISLTKDMGIDYFADPKARLKAIKDNNGQMSTGWATMDQKLYGGFNRGELQIFAGGSGSGKSLFMQNLSVNWVEMGKNGIFITLELNEGLCAMRVDSMMTGTASKMIFKNIDDVEMKVKMKAKSAGTFQIKYFPAQSNVNDIRAYVKELNIKSGNRIDFICIDYLDLLMPVTAKVGPSDLFVKDKYVSEEIRNLAKELDVVMVTASQLNRSAVEEVEFDHSMISGGISKINTADNVFGIFTSRAMRERGKYQLQLMKTRSSAGVGQKIDLDFDVDTLRIVDTGQPGHPGHSNSPSNILNNIKAKSVQTPQTSQQPALSAPQDGTTVTATVDSARLNVLLDRIKK